MKLHRYSSAFGIVTVLATLTSVPAGAAAYKIDASHTGVQFKVGHLVISSVNGRFNQFEGGFSLDDKGTKLEKLNVKVDTASIDTNDKKRDEHLKGPDFFDVAKFPKMEFKAKKAVVAEKTTSELSGDLTIHGVTKPVKFSLEYKGKQKDPWGNEHIVFTATTKIDRKDFGLKWNKQLDSGGLLIGEEVQITIDGEALENKPDNK